MQRLTIMALLISLFMTIASPAYASGPYQNGNPMRIALSLGQGAKSAFEEGYVFKRGLKTATNLTELQELYNDAGATEMFVRINTKRYNDGDLSISSNLRVRLEHKKLPPVLSGSSFFRNMEIL